MRIPPQLLRSIENWALLSFRNASTAGTIVTTAAVNRVYSPPRRQLTVQTKPRIETRTQETQKPELIIFDKDGTLICFHSMWIPWAVDTAKRLEQATGLPLSRQIYKLLGLSPAEGKVRPGLLAEGTMAQIKHELQKLLIRNGRGTHYEFEVIDKCIQDSHLRCPSSFQAIQDMQLLFGALKDNDVKTAVCTADNRVNTVAMLRRFGVEDLVDVLVCGDDPGSKPKPHPRNASFICQATNTPPENTVMVGDTLADLGMARAAGLGAAIGVLSGVGSLEHLKSHADILVPDVGSLLTIFLGIEYLPKNS